MVKKDYLKSINGPSLRVPRSVTERKMSGSAETTNISSFGKDDSLHQQGKRTNICSIPCCYDQESRYDELTLCGRIFC